MTPASTCGSTSNASATGTISAGCLESDVIEHAKRVIRVGAAKLVEYDTASTGEEMAWGLGLGCNGVVRVLVEPLTPGSLYVEALRRSCEAQADAAPVRVATVYQHTPSGSAHAAARVAIGARLYIDEGGEGGCENLSGEVASLIAVETLKADYPQFGTDGVQIVVRALDAMTPRAWEVR